MIPREWIRLAEKARMGEEARKRKAVFEVRCRTFDEHGLRDTLVKVVSDEEEALKIANILKEGASSNPRTRAVFYVRRKGS